MLMVHPLRQPRIMPSLHKIWRPLYRKNWRSRFSPSHFLPPRIMPFGKSYTSVQLFLFGHVVSHCAPPSIKKCSAFFSQFPRLLIAAFCLTLLLPHCRSEQEPGPDTDRPLAYPDYVPPVPPPPPPPPILPPDGGIYLWITDCFVVGNMTDDTGVFPQPACDPMSTLTATSGVARGSQICGLRYAMDVPAADRTRIESEIMTRYGTAPNHTAFLGCIASACSGYELRANDPPNIRGRNGTLMPLSLQVKRPDETIIANNWNTFFRKTTANVVASVSAVSPAVSYWTNYSAGINSTVVYLLAGSVLPTDRCGGDWSINSAPNRATTGSSDQQGPGRLEDSTGGCTSARRLLCIIH